MKGARFSESQILAVLKKGEARTPASDLLRKHGNGLTIVAFSERF